VSVPRVDPLARLDDSLVGSAGSLLVLSAVALLPSLFAPFVADDYFHVAVASRLHDGLTRGWVLPIDLAGTWWTPHGLSVEYFRPLVVLSFALDLLVYGAHAAGYHMTNLALHGAATLLAWAIARRVLGAGFRARAAAGLFAMHPCHVQAVGWISGRTDLLAALLYMAALLLYLESRGRQRAAALLVALSLSVFFLALLAKEMAITLPVVLLAHCLLRPEREPLARRLVAPALATAVAGLYLALRTTVLGGLHAPPSPFAYHLGDPGLLFHVVTAPLLYLGDLTLFVPADPMVTVPFWSAHPVLLVLFAGIVIHTFSRLLRRVPDRNTLAWGLGWLAVTLTPVLMLTVGEHFLYLPSLGYCILAASQLPLSQTDMGERERRDLAVASFFVLAVCIGRTILFERVAYASARTVEEAAAALDGRPDARLLLVADVPTGASLAFALALRFARPERKTDVEILSILPALTAGNGEGSRVTVALPDRIELRRDHGFLGSYVERALSGPRRSFAEGETFERPGHTVTVLAAPGGQLRAFETRLFDPARTLVLGESEHGLVPLMPSPPAAPAVTQPPSGPTP
jgi:hypothetical protein